MKKTSQQNRTRLNQSREDAVKRFNSLSVDMDDAEKRLAKAEVAYEEAMHVAKAELGTATRELEKTREKWLQAGTHLRKLLPAQAPTENGGAP